MDNITNTLTPWLDHLQVLLPPAHVILIGAGNGKGTWVQWLQTKVVPSTLIEADSQQFEALQRLLAAGNSQQMTLLNSAIAPEEGPVEFFTASLAAESGLLRPESLRHLWPNLYTVAAEPVQAAALAPLLQAERGQKWLILDCLPAATLLVSAQVMLPQVDVVLARGLLTQDKAQQFVGCSLVELAQALPGFIQLALQSSRHPDIAYVLFARDYRSSSQWASQALDTETKARQAAQQAQSALKAQLEQAQAEKSGLLKKQELQAQTLQALEVDLTQTIQALEAETHARQTAQQARAELQTGAYKQTQELVQQIEHLSKANNEQAKLVQDHKMQIRRLMQDSKLQGFPQIYQSINEKNFNIFAEIFVTLQKEGAAFNASCLTFEYKDRKIYFFHIVNDYIPQQIIENGGFYELPFLELLRNICPPQSVVVDCGANIGNHAVFFAKIMKADVIAFEPQPQNISFLQANIIINECVDKVRIIKKGVGERNEKISLYQAIEDNYGSFTSLKDSVQKEEGGNMKFYEIDVVRMDDEIYSWQEKISLIKIDIEGMELLALKGAEKIIEKNLPIITVECFTRVVFEEIKKFLKKWEYFVFAAENGTPTFIFLSKNNKFHSQIVLEHLESASLNKYKHRASFVSS